MVVMLKKSLKQLLAAEELGQMIGAYDIVGDIAVVSVPPSLFEKEQLIAETLLAAHRQIKVVAKRNGVHAGEFRTRPLQIIAGENRKETEVREFGIRLFLNLETVYYSVRSGHERRRIAGLVLPGESVLVLFSGVAPYPLMIAAYARPKRIVGIEKNLEAHRYGLDNLRRNRCGQQIDLYHGDVGQLPAIVPGRFDRVVMPLPQTGELFLPAALTALAGNGWLHFYDMQHKDQTDLSVAKVARACATAGKRLLSSTVTRCGHCGPYTFRICIDARVSA
jgi:tRNA (guanine37-N1)-methyltransferase